jgi:sugar lactone lactonase YvrE
MSDVEVVLDAHAELGEGPLWDPEAGRLLWVDILAGAVHTLDPATGEDEVFDVGGPVGVVRRRAAGGLVAATEHGFAALDPEAGTVRPLAALERPGGPWRFNDGACDPQGRFWAGTLAYDLSPEAASLYRLDADGTVARVLDSVTISNGIAWTPDGGTAFYVDSPTLRIDAFDFDPDRGWLSNRRTAVSVDVPAGAMPDGLTLDAQGGLWVALYGGGAVRRYTPAGTLETEIAVPATNVTACAFGGEDLATLFITTARQELSDDQLAAEPHAGAVFAVRPGVTGLPAHEYAG